MAWPTAGEYLNAVQNPQNCFADAALRGSAVTQDRFGLPLVTSGAFACVFQLCERNQSYAVRCFVREVTDQGRRYEQISEHLKNVSPPCFANFSYFDNGIRVNGKWYPIVRMAWVDGESLLLYAEKIRNSPHDLVELASKFRALVGQLQGLSIAHGDLQHGNILVTPQHQLKLVDYDGMCVPAMVGEKAPELGHPNFQHPERRPDHFDASLDNFAAHVIFLSLLAQANDDTLWAKYNNGDNLLFRHSDFEAPQQSAVFSEVINTGDFAVSTIGGILWDACRKRCKVVPSLEETLRRIPNKELFALKGGRKPLGKSRPCGTRGSQGGTRHMSSLWVLLARQKRTGLAAIIAVAAVLVAASLIRHGPSLRVGLPVAGQRWAVPALGMEMVAVEAGSFRMGSGDGDSYEQPIHMVEIRRPFWIGTYEVTQSQYRAMTGKSPSYFKGSDLPVESVSWNDAVEFCRKLTDQEGKAGRLLPGYVYRLPTEAEWEYAARGGANGGRFVYAGSDHLSEVAWHSGNSSNQTHPIGQKQPNELSLYDMSGNVEEWCHDWYDADYYSRCPTLDPTGPPSGDYCVLRGGSYDSPSMYCRSICRRRMQPGSSFVNRGFRVVLSWSLD